VTAKRGKEWFNNRSTVTYSEGRIMNYMGGKTVKITDIKKFQLTNSMEQSTS